MIMPGIRVLQGLTVLLHLLWGAYADLVVSFAVYGPGSITGSPFLLSLRASGYAGKVVLATGTSLSEDDLAFMKRLYVDHIPIEVASDKTMATRLGPMHVQVGRYFFYQDAVKNAGLGRDDRVLISDFRDTYFQAHPFENAYSRGRFFDLQFFEETSYTITGAFWNWTSYWITCCFGDEALRTLETYPVLCSGTTMGTVQGVAHYLFVFLEVLEGRLTQGTEEQQSNCKNVGGVDQGIHNYVVLNGMLKKFVPVMFPNGHGPINTVGAACSPPTRDDKKLSARPLLQDPENYVLNQDGQRSPIIHQYDRCGELESTVLYTWRPIWNAEVPDGP